MSSRPESGPVPGPHHGSPHGPHHRPFQSHRAMTAVITLSLLAVGSAIYLSPTGATTAGGSRPDAFSAPLPASSSAPGGSTLSTDAAVPGAGLPGAVTPPAASPSTPKPVPTGAVPSWTRRTPGTNLAPVYRTVRDSTGTVVRREIVYVKVLPGRTTTRTATKTATKTAPAKPKRLWCTDFRWQQDAQAAYLANLSDPWGLDGAPGPYNGDGIACAQLPVDRARPASTPVAAYQPPPPAAKPALVAPASKYFGVAQDGLPGDSTLFASLSRQVGKAPNSIQWFSTWDHGFEPDKVKAAWSHGALPVVTWMTVADDPTSPTAGSYTLAKIVAGQFDRYLLAYAGAIVRTGLPLVLRFDHEMNGNWFPWSAGMKANQSADPAQPNLYVQAWRHIWDVFDSVGANDDVIWLWSPVRVDNIKPHSLVAGYKYQTSLDEDYPGDRYVDWTGMSAYQYKPTDGWTYEATFRKTLNALKDLAPRKPIFVAETGATENVGTTNYAAQKAQWTAQTLAGFAAESGLVGFSWFNNTVNDVHMVDGVKIQTDWQFTSSPQSLSAFSAGVSTPRYGSGTMPDPTTK